MARRPLPIAHYENLLYKKFGVEYSIHPLEQWHGVRTDVYITCSVHKTNREVWLQKVFNGKNSTWACRQCYLDSLKADTEQVQVKSCNGSCTNCQLRKGKLLADTE